MQFGWFERSVAAMVLLVPTWLVIRFLSRYYAIRPELIMVWVYLGYAVIVGGWLWLSEGVPARRFLPPNGAALMLALIPVVLGAIANVFVYQALNQAPNPGLPTSIMGVNNMLVTLAAVLLSNLLPRYGQYLAEKELGWQYAVGVLLIVSGVGLIAVRR
jgi:drug/metabolite transporter (DMT)-like permease